VNYELFLERTFSPAVFSFLQAHFYLKQAQLLRVRSRSLPRENHFCFLAFFLFHFGKSQKSSLKIEMRGNFRPAHLA